MNLNEFAARAPIALRTLWRTAHQRINPVLFHTINVNEFPKCGGTWLSLMISEVLNYRFDDNIYPWFGKAVVKHHKKNLKRPNLILLVRDPRDVALSFYHHTSQVFSENGFNSVSVQLMQENIFRHYHDEETKLAAFVQKMTQNPIFPRFTWGEFYRAQLQKPHLLIRYEDLRTQPEIALTAVLNYLDVKFDKISLLTTIERHNIEKLKRDRKNDTRPSFIRSGTIGEWKSILKPESVDLIEKDAGELMARFGYK